MSTMTIDERRRIAHEAMEWRVKGNEEKYREVLRGIPMTPAFADGLKKIVGVNALLDVGINLDDAVEAYGEEWLKP